MKTHQAISLLSPEGEEVLITRSALLVQVWRTYRKGCFSLIQEQNYPTRNRSVRAVQNQKAKFLAEGWILQP